MSRAATGSDRVPDGDFLAVPGYALVAATVPWRGDLSSGPIEGRSWIVRRVFARASGTAADR